jgi:heme exporter protein B
MSYFFLIFKREYLFACRHSAEIIQPWIFFLLLLVLFPLALNPDPKLLQLVSPGIIWVGILLSILLSLDKLFRHEYEHHMIEQWLLSPIDFRVFIFIKLISYWSISLIPLLLLLPFIAAGLHLSLYTTKILFYTLLLATPSLSFMGAVFSALTVSLRQTGLLLPVLVLPFYVPVLIFAASAVSNAMNGLEVSAQLALLGAILLLTLPLAPLAAASALKSGVT